MKDESVPFRGPCSHCREPIRAFRGQTVACARCGRGNRIAGVALPVRPRPWAGPQTRQPMSKAGASTAPEVPATQIRPPWSQAALWGTVLALAGGLAFGLLYANLWNRVADAGSGGEIPIGLLAVVGGACAGVGVGLPFWARSRRVLTFRGLPLRLRAMGAVFGLGAALVGYGAVLALAQAFYFDATDAVAVMMSAASGAVVARRFARLHAPAPAKDAAAA